MAQPFVISMKLTGDASSAVAATTSARTAVDELTAATRGAAAATTAENAVLKVSAGSHGGLSTQAMSASHALRGMVEQMAMGVSPAQALTAQINHLSFAASGEGGLVGAFKGVGAAFAPLLTGPNLIAIGLLGLAAVAPSLWSAFTGSGEQQAEAALERQKALVGELTAAYPALGKALKEALNQSPQGTENQILVTTGQAIDAAQKQVAALSGKLSQQISAAFAPNFGTGNLLALFPQLREQVKVLNDQFSAGTITATTLGDKLAGLELNPDLPQIAKAVLDKFVTMTGQIAAAQIQADAFASTIDALKSSGGLIIGGDFSQLGGGFADAMKQFQAVIDSGVSPKDKLTQAYNKNIGGATDLSQIQGFTNAYKQAMAVLDQKASASSGAKAASAFQTATDAILKQTAALQAEAKTYGQSTAAIEANKIEAQLLAAAKTDHITVTDQLRAAIDGEADAYGRAAQAAKVAQLADEIAFGRSQLGRTAGDQQIASQLRGIYGDDLTSNEAQFYAGQLRVNQALTDLKATTEDIANGALQTFNQDLMNGTSLLGSLADAAGNAFQQIAQKFEETGIDKLVSSIFGGSGSSSGDWIDSLLHVFGIGGGGATAGAELGGAGSSYAIGGYTGDGGKYDPAGIVHRGEFVANASATRRHRPLLEAINSGRLPGYAAGGFVGGNGAAVMSSSATPVIFQNTYDLQGSNLTEAQLDAKLQAIQAAILKQLGPAYRFFAAHPGRTELPA